MGKFKTVSLTIIVLAVIVFSTVVAQQIAKSSRATVEVDPPAFDIDVIKPHKLFLGDTARFFANIRDSRGNKVTDGRIEWVVTDTSVMEIISTNDSSALLLMKKVGSADVIANWSK